LDYQCRSSYNYPLSKFLFLHCLFPILSFPIFDPFPPRPTKLYMVTTFFLIMDSIFFYHVILPFLLDIMMKYSFFMASWGKNWRSLLDPLLFFRCFLWEWGYRMNNHVDHSKSEMEQIAITLCVLLQILLLHRFAVTSYHYYTSGSVYKVFIIQWLLLHPKSLFDHTMLLHRSWKSHGYYSTQQLLEVMNCLFQKWEIQQLWS